MALPGSWADLPRHIVVELLAAGVPSVTLRPTLAQAGGLGQWGDLTELLGERLRIEAGEPPVDALELDPSVLTRPVDRRSLLALPRHDSSDPATATPPDTPPAYLPDVTATAHSRLVSALTALLPVSEADPTAPGLLLRAGSGDFGDGCIACAVCVRSCPEDALDLHVRDGVATLTQRPARCSGCRTCLVACAPHVLQPWRAARWSQQLLTDALLPLAVVEVTTCQRCGAPHPASAGDFCEVCSYRRAEPFGSHLPAHVAEMVARRATPPSA